MRVRPRRRLPPLGAPPRGLGCSAGDDTFLLGPVGVGSGRGEGWTVKRGVGKLAQYHMVVPPPKLSAYVWCWHIQIDKRVRGANAPPQPAVCGTSRRMSLFSSLFAGQQQPQTEQNGLFSSQNKFATSTAVVAATAAGDGGSGKKRRKQAAAGAAPAAAATEQGAPRSKKQRKGEQQQPAVDMPGKAARAAAAAAAQPAAEQQQGRQKKKEAKQGAAPAGAEEASQQQQPAAKQKPTAGGATGKGGKEAEEDARLPRTVFVGNLPATVQRKALARLFADCGAVESVRLRSLPLKAPEAGPGGKVSKMPRRGAIASGAIDADHSAHAYVVFAEEAAVEAALALNMKEVGAVLVEGGGGRGWRQRVLCCAVQRIWGAPKQPPQTTSHLCTTLACSGRVITCGWTGRLPRERRAGWCLTPRDPCSSGTCPWMSR